MAIGGTFALRGLGLWQDVGCHNPNPRNAGEKSRSSSFFSPAITPNPATLQRTRLPQSPGPATPPHREGPAGEKNPRGPDSFTCRRRLSQAALPYRAPFLGARTHMTTAPTVSTAKTPVTA